MKKDDTKMRQLDFTPKFKKELSNIEIEGIERIIDTFASNTGDLPSSEHMGFAHTSSGEFAMHNVTNNVTYLGKQLRYIAITENDMLILATWDQNENDIFYEIEVQDFYPD